jgi:hypothetical protein
MRISLKSVSLFTRTTLTSRYTAFAISVMLVSANTLLASIIVSATPNDARSWYEVGTAFNYVEAIGWNQTDAYSAVSISALVGSLDSSSETVLAYLTTALGPTAGPPVASATLTVPSFASAGDITPAMLFSGLALGPGNYYLTLFDVNPTANVAWAGASSVTTASDASLVGQYISGTGYGTVNETNPWQSTFVAQPIDYFFYDPKGFTVTGTPAGAVPEPGTLVLTSAVIGLLLTRCRSRILTSPPRGDLVSAA